MNRRNVFGSLAAGLAGLLFPWKTKADEPVSQPILFGWMVTYDYPHILGLYTKMSYSYIIGQVGAWNHKTRQFERSPLSEKEAKEFAVAAAQMFKTHEYQNIEIFPIYK